EDDGEGRRRRLELTLRAQERSSAAERVYRRTFYVSPATGRAEKIVTETPTRTTQRSLPPGGSVLGPDHKLSSLNARSAEPHGCGGQPLHADMAAVADERGCWVCNTVWLLDDYTPENGALRLVPGSHRWRRLPQQELADPLAAHPQQVLVTGRAGAVVVLSAHVWHGGTANRTARPRASLHAFYCRRDKPQQQYQKQLLRPEVQQALSAELRDLLALDDPLNDQLSAEVTVRSGVLK